MDVSDTTSNPGRSTGVQQIPLWEWVLAGLGTITVLGIVGYIGFHGLAYSQAPPVVIVEVLDTSPSGDGYLVRFRARNLGSSTASSLRISGQLVRNGQAIQTSVTLLDYLAQQSQREGGLFFSEDPMNGQLLLRAEGYVDP